MITITHTNPVRGSVTVSDLNHPYEPHEYRNLIRFIVSDFRKASEIESIEASGVHLDAILNSFSGIPKPLIGLPEFTWTGTYAGLIVANIVKSLDRDISFVIASAGDYTPPTNPWFNP